MNVILFVCFIILIMGLFTNFKKTVLVYAPFKLFFIKSVVLISDISFDGIISLVVLLIYFFKSSNMKKSKEPFPLYFSFFLLATSIYTFCNIPDLHIKSFIFQLTPTLGFLFVLFKIISGVRDLKIVISSLTVFVLAMLVNAFVEFLAGVNFLGELVQSFSIKNAFFATGENLREGMHRTQSFFPHSIVFGSICSILLYFYCFLYIHYQKTKINLLIIIGLMIGVIISMSRTPLLSMIIFLIPIFLSKQLIKRAGIPVLLLATIAFCFLYDYIYSMVNSIFADSGADLQGSSMDLRIQQLEYTLFLISRNPFLGIGISFDLEKHSEFLYGAESIWFILLIGKGIWGVITYLSLYIEIILKSLKNKYFIYILFLCLGWLLANSASNMSGMDDYCFLLLFIMLYKLGYYSSLNERLLVMSSMIK